MTRSVPSEEPILLPEQTRLLYIGPPKTGTTTVQQAAANARKALYEQGTYYPGKFVNHRREVYALMSRPEPLSQGRVGSPERGKSRDDASHVPPMTAWQDLLADIGSEPTRRIWITHESAGTASDDIAQKFVDELGPGRTHIAISVRPLASTLASLWVEFVKEGVSEPLDKWVQRYFGIAGAPLAQSIHNHLGVGSLVERWASAAGSKNVTVIMVDPRRRDLLTDTFEQLLGLRPRTLTGTVEGGDRTNRSLSLPEAEVIRRVNARVYNAKSSSWLLYRQVMRSGAIMRLLRERTPAPGEPKIRVPRWAADESVQRGAQDAQRIAETGVNVVGELSNLYSEAAVAEAEPDIDPECFRNIAIEALAGATLGAAKMENQANNELSSLKKDYNELNRTKSKE